MSRSPREFLFLPDHVTVMDAHRWGSGVQGAPYSCHEWEQTKVDLLDPLPLDRYVMEAPRSVRRGDVKDTGRVMCGECHNAVVNHIMEAMLHPWRLPDGSLPERLWEEMDLWKKAKEWKRPGMVVSMTPDSLPPVRANTKMYRRTLNPHLLRSTQASQQMHVRMSARSNGRPPGDFGSHTRNYVRTTRTR